jgi:RNA polymerase sigma factor (sigma-70 family)
MDATGFRSLLRRAQAGDRHSLDDLLAALRPHLETLARPFADPACAAESTSDLVQEAELRAWQRLHQFKGTDDDEGALAMFRAWVGQFVRRLGQNARRHRRRKRRRPDRPVASLDAVAPGQSANLLGVAEPHANEPSPSTNVRADERTQSVLQALAALPDEQERQIVRLRFFDGLSLRDIAGRLGLTYDVVRERYRVSKQRLGRALEGLR